MNKMSLEEFRSIKKEIENVLSEAENVSTSDDEKVLIERYMNALKRLEESDLSDIPFEEWDGVSILTPDERTIDFSKTKANLDFGLIQYDGGADFRGCNIRNLERYSHGGLNTIFDEETIKKYPNVFLSDSFSDDFKNKYYKHNLVIEDFDGITQDQFVELVEKNILNHIDYSRASSIFFNYNYYDPSYEENDIRLKMIELYMHSSEEYYAVLKILELEQNDYIYGNYQSLIGIVNKTAIDNIKDTVFKFEREALISSKKQIEEMNYPELFKNENADLFLINYDIPDHIKEKFFRRELWIKDVIGYPDAFKNINLDYFYATDSALYGDRLAKALLEKFGSGKTQELVFQYPILFSHLVETNSISDTFITCLQNNTDFADAVVDYFFEYESYNYKNGEEYTKPEWLSEFNYGFVREIETKEDFLNYHDSLRVRNKNQRLLFSKFGVDNLKKFDKETGFITRNPYDQENGIMMFEMLSSVNRNMGVDSIDFKHGTLSYEEFSNEMAKLLGFLVSRNVFTDYPNYHWIRGKFRDEHPEIFLSLDAPKDLEKAFYSNKVTPEYLSDHREYISYLKDKDLSKFINVGASIIVSNSSEYSKTNRLNFVEVYSKKFGNDKTLELLLEYGRAMHDLNVSVEDYKMNSSDAIEKELRRAIYYQIKIGAIDYSFLENSKDMVSQYPEIFVDFSKLKGVSEEERKFIKNDFYGKGLDYATIRKYPQILDILKDKDLNIVFRDKILYDSDGRIKAKTRRNGTEKTYSELELSRIFGNDKFLDLCAEYGEYLDFGYQEILPYVYIKNDKYYKSDISGFNLFNGQMQNPNDKELSFEEVQIELEKAIADLCKRGKVGYNPKTCPDFLKRDYPELFLPEDAPADLKECYYEYGRKNGLFTLKTISEHKEWLPYLKGRNLSALIRDSVNKKEMELFIKSLGEEKALKLGVSRRETVYAMINSGRTSLMLKWYEKTGRKFIPDFVVMHNFNINDADKFLAAGPSWSNLMKNQDFAKTPESRDAMLKLAYSFGVFDNDPRGYKRLVDLLTGLPSKIKAENASELDKVNEVKENNYALHEYYEKSGIAVLDFDYHLRKALESDGVKVDENKSVISNVYRKNPDGSYTLVLDIQKCPETTRMIRSFLANSDYRIPIISPERAHKLFGGFSLEYNPDFREFLLSNLDELISNPDYYSLISSIQRNFKAIKTINSNRQLTLERAISYVQSNKYDYVDTGNERAAEISAIAGYSQVDFDTLQKIYNHGKQRAYSSIPRVERKSGEYSYEMLRLDDPLAMAVGTLSDCCQELNNCAEVCMEHSMVDKNGRIFVVRDEDGNIVAQSWVWRNKDVLCFDNIEIPDKAFARHQRENGGSKLDLAQKVYDLYKQAAKELIEADEKVYKELLDKGQITEEQYNGLRLGKVTVGIGYNDIAEALQKNAQIDKERIARPLPFDEPVKLSRGLYTNDSRTQYVLEKRDDRVEYEGDTLTVHNDEFIEYNDELFDDKKLDSLEKLEMVTKDNPRYLDTSVDDRTGPNEIVSSIARNYGLNPITTRIILHPNFAIIYDTNDKEVRIGDLLYNTKYKNNKEVVNIEDKVLIQMRLALEQISKEKEVNVSNLSDYQKEMYEKIVALNDELDIERGVGHAR